MKILLDKITLSENQEVDADKFVKAVEAETAIFKARFPDCTEIVGRWKNNRYVLYCVEEIFPDDEVSK